MNTVVLIKSSLHSLNHHKGRTLLTMLGIIIGIASIIGTLSIGYGAEEKIRAKILAMGNNNVEIWAGRSLSEGAIGIKYAPPKKLVIDDINFLCTQCPTIHYITPFLHGRECTSYQGKSIMTQLKGGNDQIFNALRRTIHTGKPFNREQVKRSSRIIILGSKAAQALFQSHNPLGKTVTIKRISFTVIGVLAPIQHYFGTQDPNLDIFMPYTTLKNYILNLKSNQIYGIIASTKLIDELPALVKRVRQLFRSKHNLDTTEPDDFSMTDQLSMLKAAKASSSVFNLFLFIIASISLLVGGIGVMNIMLVSVTERTKEIGIRMAIGASTSLIRKQFLIESICICTLGGIIGIILGVIAPFGAHYLAGFPIVLKLQPIVISFITIFFIGIFFGFYPAHKASRLNPIDALNEK